MAPNFGMFDFVPVRIAELSTIEAEREAFLSEVCATSTEFGVGARSEAKSWIDDCLRVAVMYRF